MKNQKSSIEAWGRFSNYGGLNNGLESFLPLILSWAGALGVLPFMVIRWLDGQWVIAAIDTVIVIGFAALGMYVYRTKRARGASIAISILAIIGTVVTVYVRGADQVYWIYPTLMACFFLLKPIEAIVIVSSVVALVIPQVLGNMPAFEVAVVVITVIVTSAFAYAFAILNNRQNAELTALATRDPLTGVGNRRALDQKLGEVVASYQRNRKPSSLVMIDLDHFKKVNDIHGHAMGDEILKQVSEIINLRIRITDGLYRIGGEEFVVVADDQEIDSAMRLAEQLRTLVEANELVPDRTVTISVGVAEIRPDESAHNWLKRADTALYCAKREGRNTIRLAI